MKKYSILLSVERQTDIDEIKPVIIDAGYEIVGETLNGEEALNLVGALAPDIIVTGLVLPGVDGLKIISDATRQLPQTKVIVLSSISSDSLIKTAIERGASYYMTTPIDPQVLKERISELVETKPQEGGVRGETRHTLSLDERISKIFISVGIPPHIKGYTYLREGVKIAVSNPSVINSITKKLYPMIGDRYATSASKVERAIRHAIEVAWNRNRIETINAVFGVRAYVNSEKPTNGEFIALVADKMLMEGF